MDGGGNHYAGGDFTTAGGVTANRIARWDGLAWSALDSGTNASVSALAMDSGSILWVGGAFTTAGDLPSARFGEWIAEAIRRSDFDDDGTVDLDDIITIASLWNQPGGWPYDMSGDGTITIVDIQRVTRWWGRAAPSS